MHLLRRHRALADIGIVEAAGGVGEENHLVVAEHRVAGGGVLAFCPEGTVNRKDQTKCLPLRRGSFQLAVDLRLPIYGISALGQSATRSLY